MRAVEINNVSVYYNNVCALKNVNLQVEEKQFLAIIGPNGAGKTTLIKVILGLINPNKGEVKIFDQDVKDSRHLIGYVPQAASFPKNLPLNVLDVVLMGRLRRGNHLFHHFNKEDRKIAHLLLTKLKLEKLKDRQIGKLSGGQLQKVLLARALAVEPKIMILDEPTASIDVEAKNQIYAYLKELNKEKTIIIVTHDLAAVSAYFDSIACLNKTMHYHGGKEIDQRVIDKTFGCPIDLIAHGVPHRVLRDYKEELDD